MLPYPRQMKWQDWVDTVVGYNPDLRNKVSPDSDWESFADKLTQFVPQTPSHRMFQDWQAWAEALIRTVSP